MARLPPQGQSLCPLCPSDGLATTTSHAACASSNAKWRLAEDFSLQVMAVVARAASGTLPYGADGCAAARGGTTLSPTRPPRRFTKGRSAHDDVDHRRHRVYRPAADPAFGEAGRGLRGHRHQTADRPL